MEQRIPSTRCGSPPAPARRTLRWFVLVLMLVSVVLPGCGAPFLSPDGFIVFPEHGDNGAMVITPNGVQYRDRRDIPQRVVYSTPFEPWRNPVGFIAPADGVFTHTSRPVVLITPGLVVSVRPSDELVPTWGGEVLLRVDLVAPAASDTLRAPIELRLVLDGAGADSAELVRAALAHLGPDDRVTVFDARGTVVPALPGNHRSLVQAAVERRLADDTRVQARALNLAGALQNAWRLDDRSGSRGVRVMVLTDGTCARAGCMHAQAAPPAYAPTFVVAASTQVTAEELTWLSTRIGAWQSPGTTVSERAQVVASFVPPPGPIAFRNVGLRFAGVPGPSHLIETSGGEIQWDMFADLLMLGDVRAGESRTEVVRLSVPSWTQTLPFELQFSLQAAASGGGQRGVDAVLLFPYDENIARIAQLRCGDVLAYGSALAWMNRLQNAFVGPGIDRAGGLYRLARLHQASMLALARDHQDRAALEQAVALSALLDAHPPW